MDIILIIAVLAVGVLFAYLFRRLESRQTQQYQQQELTLLNQLETLLTREQAQQQRHLQESLSQNQARLYRQMSDDQMRSEQRLEQMRQTLQVSVERLQRSNEQRLEQMRQTVEEKLESTLQNRLKTSFSAVSEQLESVHKSLGEMQRLSQDVSRLNQTLSGTKSRGIMGEVQLGSIIEDVLPRSQYEREIPTIPQSTNRVEFAIKLPGQDNQEHVYLPIDSKFPLEGYQRLQNAYNLGDKEALERERKGLSQSLRQFARDINSKYVHPPQTTNFGILFLPTEGLYAEAVRQVDVIEDLRRKENVIIAGPSTIVALLNALSVGFRTLSIQQNAADISKILGNVKLEFAKYAQLLEKAQKQLGQASGNLDKLLTTRTNAIAKALSQIESYEDATTQSFLGLTSLESENENEDQTDDSR